METDACRERGRVKSGAGVPGGSGVGCLCMPQAYPGRGNGAPEGTTVFLLPRRPGGKDRSRYEEFASVPDYKRLCALASATAWVRLSAPSLPKMDVRWYRTVRSVMKSRTEISRF